jgi:hypothetical protein
MRVRDQRGAAYPSPVVMLSIIAVAMAAIAFVATRGGEPTEREVTPVAQPSASPSPSATTSTKPKPKPPAVDRRSVHVEVYNNSGITGLAGEVATEATGMGWKVVGSDNWYGTIPTSTVYFPAKLKAAAKQLALDLGIKRVMPAVDPMRSDRLTVILTAALG